MTNYLAKGGGQEQFWRSTPKELSIFFRAAGMRAEQEFEDRKWLAWHIAALTRTKRWPDFNKFMGRKTKMPPQRKTPEQIEALIRAWFTPKEK